MKVRAILNLMLTLMVLNVFPKDAMAAVPPDLICHEFKMVSICGYKSKDLTKTDGKATMTQRVAYNSCAINCENAYHDGSDACPKNWAYWEFQYTQPVSCIDTGKKCAKEECTGIEKTTTVVPE